MRVLVEGLAADFGGIRTYVENLLAAWERSFPEDQVLVLVRPGSDLETAGHPRLELPVHRPTAIGRPLAQTLHTRLIVRSHRVEVVLATLPSTGLLSPGVPLAVVVHDLRHELRPEQFTRSRRLLRRISYNRAYSLADGIIAVSRRSLDDLQRLHPHLRSTPSAVVYHGADHVLGWAPRHGVGPAITFAHHSNKNPDLILEGWAAAATRGVALPPLLILGTGSARKQLGARVSALGLDGQVELAPFLPEDEFAAVMRSASMVLFPSDFEGFGLPVLEGMLNGAPVVIGPEPATMEIAGGHAAVLADWTPDALADAVVQAGRFDAAQLEQARAHAAGFTWERSARQTREVLVGLTRA